MPTAKFHISDILSVLCAPSSSELAAAMQSLTPPPPKQQIVSLPEYPPQSDDFKWPTRHLPMEGTIALAEFITGKKVPTRLNPQTSRMQIEGLAAAHIVAEAHDKLAQQLDFMLPLDQTLMPPITDTKDKQAILQASHDALPELIEKYGEYIDIMGVGIQRTGGDKGGAGGTSTTGYQR